MSGAQAYVRGIIPDSVNRERDDFYPTPPAGTLALLSVESFTGTIWEPACGDGAISKVFEAAGHSVISTDLIDRGYGTPNVDFLLDYQTTAENIVTNPPFKHAEEFARHALRGPPERWRCFAGWAGWRAESVNPCSPERRWLGFGFSRAVCRCYAAARNGKAEAAG